MEQQTNFHIIRTRDNRIQFIADQIIITIDQFSFNNNKHEITNPYTANAKFAHLGKVYIVDNTEGILTVEDWYFQELLPKLQMLSLLMLTAANTEDLT